MSSLRLDQTQGTTGDMPLPPEDAGTLWSQVAGWLQEEKAKRVSRRIMQGEIVSPEDGPKGKDSDDRPRPRSDSQASEGAIALDKLERILAACAVATKDGMPGHGGSHRTPFALLRKSSVVKGLKPASMTMASDVEQDGELFVHNVEAVLDNSKAMAYTGGNADSDPDSTGNPKDKENWNTFKCEILRLTHTLKLKRWKRVPIEQGGDISVERLSGALTNAVYVVSPPKKLPDSTLVNESSASLTAKKPPPKLLLRIYGPQVEHLIDREAELSILRRLAKKKIGPRLLGTFTNGRFEEFLYAHTLTPEDLRVPETSKQIAKRMRELHDGIELLEEERDSGPFVWVNWDKWVDRCEQVITWLDKQILSQDQEQAISKARPWQSRGLVCGVEWPLFRKTVDKYRKYIVETHGGRKGIKERLVFAHNDVGNTSSDPWLVLILSQTQYGNLLRLQPTGESPLLHPRNEHKQLVVIDFEYANANLPGFEFANHFTEWCYNYHHPERAWSVNPAYYPKPEEQRRFVQAYVQHHPVYSTESSLTTTPKISAPSPRMNPVSSFMLDSRAPQGSTYSYEADEKAREEAMEVQIESLIRDAKLWRGMCSAHWVAWGIVQAKVPDMEQAKPQKSKTERLIGRVRAHLKPQSDPLSEDILAKQEESRMDRPEGREIEESHREGDEETEEAEEESEEFDYLAYAQDRAMFFWGDCLQLGLVKREELPEELLAKVKTLAY
jgi:choline kinase